MQGGRGIYIRVHTVLAKERSERTTKLAASERQITTRQKTATKTHTHTQINMQLTHTYIVSHTHTIREYVGALRQCGRVCNNTNSLRFPKIKLTAKTNEIIAEKFRPKSHRIEAQISNSNSKTNL